MPSTKDPFAPDLSKAMTPYEIGAATGQGTLSTTPSGGISYQGNGTQPPNSAFGSITPSSLTPQTPVNVPPAPQPTIPTDTVAGGNAQLAANSASLPQTPEPTPQSDFQSYLKMLNESLGAPPSSADQYNQDYASAGIDAKQSAYNASKAKFDALNAQLQGLNTQAQAIPLQIQQQAQNEGAIVTKGGLAPQQTAALRNNAINALAVQAQLFGAQAEMTGNQAILQQAQDHLDKIYQIHQSDATAQYNYRTNLIEKALTYANGKETQRLNEQKTQLATNHSDLMDAINNAQSLSATAISNGQSDIAAQLSALQPPDINSKTFASDLQKYRAKVAELQGKITAKQSAVSTQTVDVGGRKLLIDSKTGATIKDLGASTSGQGTQAERAASAIAQFGNAFVPGAKLPGGIPVLDTEGKLTPEAFKAAIADAPAEGLTRSEFLKEFGSYIVGADGKVSTKYGLTPKEIADLQATAK